MGHAAIENRTPFVVLPLFVADEDGRPLVVTVVRATFRIDAARGLTLADEQMPVQTAGVWWGEPDESSLRFEPETALSKPATDVVMLGHALAPRVGISQV